MVPRQLGAVLCCVIVIVVLGVYASNNKQFSEHDSPTAKSAPATTSKKAAPETEKAAPVTEKAAPVTEKAAPVTEKAAHVTEKAAPGTEKLRELQKLHMDLNFTNFIPITITEGMKNSVVAQTFKSLVNQIQIACPNWKMYGRVNNDWAVCRAKAFLPQKPCIIYSFGINYDWSFDDMYHKEHGCLVRSFDPSMGGMPEHYHHPSIPFYPVGLSGKKEIRKPEGWQMDSLKGLMTRFKDNNKTIPYMKFDIEASEWAVLDNLLQDGSLKNVMQLSFEIHVDTAKNYRKYFKLIKGLELIGFRRWYGKWRGGGFLYQSDQSYLNMNFLNGK